MENREENMVIVSIEPAEIGSRMGHLSCKIVKA